MPVLPRPRKNLFLEGLESLGGLGKTTAGFLREDDPAMSAFDLAGPLAMARLPMKALSKTGRDVIGKLWLEVGNLESQFKRLKSGKGFGAERLRETGAKLPTRDMESEVRALRKKFSGTEKRVTSKPWGQNELIQYKKHLEPLVKELDDEDKLRHSIAFDIGKNKINKETKEMGLSSSEMLRLRAKNMTPPDFGSP